MITNKFYTYDLWNEKKKILSIKDSRVLFKEGDIWWCALGINLGTESLGKGDTFRRPVLVIKKLSGESCIILPLTSQEKVGSWFIDITIHNEKNWVMLNQIRMIHTKRFQRRLGSLDDTDFVRVKEKLKLLLEFSSDNHSVETEIGGNIPKVISLYDNEIDNAIAEYEKFIMTVSLFSI